MVALEVVVAQVVARGRIALLLAAVLLAAACGRGNRYAPPPPPEVTVAHPVEREVTLYSEFTGHTVAYESLDIRARVQGYLQSFNFTPGSYVKKGDLLFVIEPELYQAQVDQAQADLQGKEAQYRAAQQQLEITQAIFERSAGSRTDLVQKTQARDLAKAEVGMARANLEAAKLNLSYTHIYAPFPGRIDRNLVDVGNLVGSGEATLLCTIVRDDPIYAYFTMSERELLQFQELQRQNRTAAQQGQGDVAYLALATERGFPHVGQVDYTSNRVDPTTGTIELRGTFPNPDHVILPGLFVRVRLPLTRERAVLVPEAAVSQDQGGQYLLLVDAQNHVEYRRVHMGQVVEGELRVVLDGVTTADQVVIEGLQRAHPGSEVKPTQSELPPAPPAQAQSSQ